MPWSPRGEEAGCRCGYDAMRCSMMDAPVVSLNEKGVSGMVVVWLGVVWVDMQLQLD